MPSVVDRLKQRKLGQWAIAYLAGAFVVLQLMDVVEEPLGLSLSFQQSVLFLLPVAFLLVCVLAWYHGEQGRQRVGGAELVMIMVLLGVAGVGLTLLNTGEGPSVVVADESSPVGDLTLAVLPLANLSSESDNQYFSDGLTAAIHNELSRVGALQIASRTSTVRFQGVERDIRKIGAELGVRYLLGGGVFKDGDRIRIDVQLSDVSTGFDVWSESFTGGLANVLALQEETAFEIANALGIRLNAQEADALRRRYTENVEAYDAYLRGSTLLQSFHARIDVPEERLEAARGHFERAITSDPDYALAIAGLSMIESYYVFFGADGSRDRLQSALDLAERALALDPVLPEAHAALGEAYVVAGEYSHAIDTYQEALRLDPDNAVIWCHLAYACNQTAPPDPIVAEESALEAVRLHPTYFFSYVQLGRALELQARDEEAIAAFEQTIQLNPDYSAAYTSLGDLYLERGDFDKAVAVYEGAWARQRDDPTWLVEISFVYATRGDTDESLLRLEAAFDNGYRDFTVVENNPSFAALRGDSRLRVLLDRYR